MAYSLINICTKIYWNRTSIVKIIVGWWYTLRYNVNKGSWALTGLLDDFQDYNTHWEMTLYKT